jgi:exodeoxyribonuclease VII small subunit
MFERYNDMSEAIDFEQSMTQLEEIVRRLESGKLSLEESIRLYGEGTQISQKCKAALAEAQLTVKTINSKDDE